MPQEPLQLDTVGWNRKLKLWQRKLPTRQARQVRQGVGKAGAIFLNFHINYTTVDPKQWVDSRSVLRNRVKHMRKH